MNSRNRKSDSATRLQTLVVVPARMASTRLPGKPLADIGGTPMIVHVARCAASAEVGEVVVATDHADIARAVEAAGFNAVMTSPSHQSGSDRIWEAATRIDAQGKYQVIVNLQGDLPALPPDYIGEVVSVLEIENADIATLAAPVIDHREATNPNVVKVVATPQDGQRMRALYFTRAAAPYGDGPLFHHIGIYAYRRKALEKFVSLPQSPLEKRESLEQLRALEHGMHIEVAVVDHVPAGVDTPADLEMMRRHFKENISTWENFR